MVEQAGLRERKRQQTRQRIVDAGLQLFLTKGIEATTLDEIATRAEISRRSFFSYFAAKEDIALAWQDGAEEALRAAVTAAAPGREPLAAVQHAVKSLAPLFATHDFMRLDALMQSTPTLKAKKEQHFEHQSECLFITLAELWPDPARRKRLQVVAMVSIGCLKIGVSAWLAEQGRRPIGECLDEAFAALRTEIADAS
jgi:AcrR family transcriptional regulator